MADATRADADLPETVLTYGGGKGRVYHRVIGTDGEHRPACGRPGRNPLLKTRSLIESHYDACLRCFPNARDGDQ